jgi:acyltransferase
MGRVSWVDNLKALAIFLVTWGHLIGDSPVRQYFSCFIVPLFFFASGLFFDRSKYDFGQFFWKRIRTLIVPYLFFATISFLFWFFVVRHVSLGGKALATDPLKPFIGIFYGIGSGDWRAPLNLALWFLPCLFVVEIIFYFVRNRLLLVVFAVLGYLVTLLPFRLPWSADVAFMGVVFYGLGHFYKDTPISHKALPVLFALHLVFSSVNAPVDVNTLQYGNMLYFYIAAFSGVMFYSALCQFTKKNRILDYVGRNTIVLIGCTGIIWFIVRGLWYVLFGTKLGLLGPVPALAASVGLIALTTPVIYCIDRWFPFLLGRASRRAPGSVSQ